MVDKKVKELSDYLSEKSQKESECYPIDRYFLEPYIKDILRLEKSDFLFYNIENLNNTYTVQLMLCLPELWEYLILDDILFLCTKFTNSFSFYALILFTYKYLEIDIIEPILELQELPDERKKDIREYLKNQYSNFLKSDGEIFVIDESIIGIKNDKWMYLKQKFLLDNRIKPALVSLNQLELYINRFAT